MKTMGNKGFHALRSPHSNLKTAKVVIIPFCYAPDVAEAFYSPGMIIEASHEVSPFDESLMAAGGPVSAFARKSLKRELDIGDVLKKRGLATIECLRQTVIGPVARQKLNDDFQKKILQLLQMDKFPVIIGGDHNITPLAIKAFKENFDNLAVLHFDSRLDLGNSKEAKHRSVMRKIFPEVDFIVSVGYRSVKREEMHFLKKNEDKIHGIMMRDQLRPLWHLETAMKSIIHYLKGRNVYITFDASFLDPSTIGHAVKTPEPDGMTYGEVLDLWKKLLPHPELNIVGADFVEFYVPKDNRYNTASAYGFARLISRFISRLNLDKKEG